MRANRKNMITRISAIVLAAFIAAVSIPVSASASTGTVSKSNSGISSSSVMNIAKVDFESRSAYAGATVIADNEIPLAAAPAEGGINMTWWWMIVIASFATTGFVIIECAKDRRSYRD
ncbi:MAG: hypothetical protein K6F73_00205 [Lachnospiraceae bacterium]|nr:hypothetical protein [Lachnospiraceae bacterium]